MPDENTVEPFKSAAFCALELSKIDGLEVEVVRNWCWVGGDTKPHKDMLKSRGLHYAWKKKMWYWKPEGDYDPRRRGLPMSDIRMRYGTTQFRDGKAIQLSAENLQSKYLG